MTIHSFPGHTLTGEEEFDYVLGQTVRPQKPSIMSLESETVNGARYPVLFVDTEAMPTGSFGTERTFLPYVKLAVTNSKWR